MNKQQQKTAGINASTAAQNLRRSMSTLSSQKSNLAPPPPVPPSSASANHLGKGDSAIIDSAMLSPRGSSRNLKNNDSSNVNKPVSFSSSAILPSSSVHNKQHTCDYCGVSYLTMSENRALQTKIHDQEVKLASLKEALSEAAKLKESLSNVRKLHRAETSKRDEETQRWVLRCTALENELEKVRDNFKITEAKNSDLASKYAIASEDFKQQEELICQLRGQLQNSRDSQAEAQSLKVKNSSLEENLQKLLAEIKSLRSSSSSYSGNVASPVSSKVEGFSIAETALKAKVSELTDRCNRLSNENALFQQEISNLIQKNSQHKNYQNHSRVSDDIPSFSNPASTKTPSVVTVQVHDLKRENALLTSRLEALQEEHSNCQDMHAFLRESIEKLKSDNARLLDDTNSSRHQQDENLLKIQNFQAIISGYQAERTRFMSSYKEQQVKMEQLAAQNRAFHKSSDPKTIDDLKSQIGIYERQVANFQNEKHKLQEEFAAKSNELQREVSMEKERADSCLTQSLTERETVEKRWQERWTRHHNKLNDQLEILKTNYEASLKSAKERECSLETEIRNLHDRLVKNEESWTDMKNHMLSDLKQWKCKCQELEEECAQILKNKVEVEVMFQEKTLQLEELQEAVRQGIEERQELQRVNENLERNIQETSFTNSSSSTGNFEFPNFLSNISSTSLVSPSKTHAEPSLQETSADDSNLELKWKESQNIKNSPRKNPRDMMAGKSPRMKPVSPFPPSGRNGGGAGASGKSAASPGVFTVGNGNKSKVNKVKSKNSGIVFSVAAPNPSRKSLHK